MAIRPLLLLICSLPSALIAPQLAALPDDAEQELYIEAETFKADGNAGTMTYSGSVIMRQGSMSIRADELVIQGEVERESVQRVKTVIARGKPAQFQQTPSAGSAPVTAKALQLEYQISDKWLLLQGKASLDQEGLSLSGNRIEYDVKKSLVKANKATGTTSTNERVRVVFPPKVLESAED